MYACHSYCGCATPQNLWANVEQGTASLQQYLASMQVRQDTKLSLMSGLLLGTVVVVIIAIYPGKPIDYSQDGECIFSHLLRSCFVYVKGEENRKVVLVNYKWALFG